MADLVTAVFFVLVGGLLSFVILVAAIYYGTTLALRSYFGGEDVGPGDIASGAVRLEDDEGER